MERRLSNDKSMTQTMLLLLCRDALGSLTIVGLTEVPRAPFANGSDDRNEALPLAGQPILHLGGDDAVILSIDEAAKGERFQLAAEDSGSDFLRSCGSSQQAAS